MDKKNPKKQFPQLEPEIYFGFNLLLQGLSYILLRQYTRFFILLAFITFFSYVRILYILGINLISIAIIVFSAIDAMNIARKMKENKIPIPKKNIPLNIISVILWTASISLFVYFSFFT